MSVLDYKAMTVDGIHYSAVSPIIYDWGHPITQAVFMGHTTNGKRVGIFLSPPF